MALHFPHEKSQVSILGFCWRQMSPAPPHGSGHWTLKSPNLRTPLHCPTPRRITFPLGYPGSPERDGSWSEAWRPDPAWEFLDTSKTMDSFFLDLGSKSAGLWALVSEGIDPARKSLSIDFQCFSSFLHPAIVSTSCYVASFPEYCLFQRLLICLGCRAASVLISTRVKGKQSVVPKR